MKQTDQISYLDIVFKGRNKEYGAYELRTNYDRRLYASLAITLAATLLVVFSSFISPKQKSPEKFIVRDVTLTEIKTVPPKEEPKKELQKNVQVKTVKFTTPVIVDKVDPNNLIKEIDNNSKIGTENIEGIPVDSAKTQIIETVIADTVQTIKEDPNAEVKIVDSEASFPGGFSAWKRFLETTLNASVPVENGAPEGTYTIVVSFLVDRDGRISEVEALNDPGYGIANEAIKVVKKSKVWNPATKNGSKVTYRQRQKIVFQVSGE